MCVIRLTFYTISLLINVEFCSIEELNVLKRNSLRFSFMFTGCGDLASWIFFMGVSILITSGWVLVAMITTFH